jgi:hypothetical protein
MRPGESDDDLILRLAGSGEPREGQNRRRGGSLSGNGSMPRHMARRAGGR